MARIRRCLTWFTILASLGMSVAACSSDSSIDDCRALIAQAEEQYRSLQESVRRESSPGGSEVTADEASQLRTAQDELEGARGCNV